MVSTAELVLIGTILSRSQPERAVILVEVPDAILTEVGDPSIEHVVVDYPFSVDTVLHGDSELTGSPPITTTLRFASSGDPAEVHLPPYVGRRYMVFVAQDSSVGIDSTIARVAYVPLWDSYGMIDMDDPDGRVRYAHGDIVPFAQTLSLPDFQQAVEDHLALEGGPTPSP
jgi:hypothetical protein